MKTLKNTVVALAFATLVSLTSLTAMANESDTRSPATQVTRNDSAGLAAAIPRQFASTGRAAGWRRPSSPRVGTRLIMP